MAVTLLRVWESNSTPRTSAILQHFVETALSPPGNREATPASRFQHRPDPSEGGGVMPLNTHKLELLWRQVEDTKLQLDHCHNYIREIQQDKITGAVPEGDGNLACRHALRTEAVAVNRYLKALNEFKAALALEPGPEEANTDGNSRLTPREREVLALIACGKSSKEISHQLGISFRTVVCHRYRIQKKLSAGNTADLTRAALKMGLTEL